MRFRILIMAKAPIPGAVKTRLRLDPEDAAGLQKAFILDTVEKARRIAPTTVAGAPGNKLDLIRPLLPRDVDLVPQPGGDLGKRMLSAVQGLFGLSPEPVIVLGTDAPTLPEREMLDSARALESHDLSVVGSADGGYVLLGLRRPTKAVFAGIEWSTGSVYRQTLARAGARGLSVHEGRTWYDVDEPDDLRRLHADLQDRPDLAPRTTRALRQLDVL